jgi:N-methylhydantoinase B
MLTNDHGDKVTLEITKNYFIAIAEAMAHTMVRTAHTTFVKETADFSTGISTPAGEFFSYPRNLGVSAALGLNLKAAIDCIDSYDPGDIVITNDPYSTQGLASHLPDVHMFKPIFIDGELLCFAWCFIHCSDVGGLVPASISARAYDVQQEGLRLTPKKIYRQGNLDRALLSIFLDNCRIPDKNWGDIKAMTAALNAAERRMKEMCVKFGTSVVKNGMYDLLDWTEELARSVYSQIPDGDYSFHDYLDDALDGVPIRLAVTVKVRGSDIELDYSGTDPQVQTSMNLPAFGGKHPLLAQALINFAFTHNPSIPLTGAIMRPIRTVTQLGSVLNPRFPAAVGWRYATVIRLYDVVNGALAQAVPDLVPAAGCGQGCMVVLSTPDLATGERQVAVLQPFMGGGAATARTDGVMGIDSANGSMRNTPTESIESDLPVIIRRFGARTDSAGAGEHRGGSGIVLEFEVVRPHSIVTARGMERCRFEPWGRAGGHASGRTTSFVNLGKPGERELGNIDVSSFDPGDIVTMWAAGGGGFGDPLDRDSEVVGGDVRTGYVTQQAAEQVYGVICDARGIVDRAATVAKRESLRSSRPTPQVSNIDLGPTRTEYEKVWTNEASRTLSSLLFDLPPALRSHAKVTVHQRADAAEQGALTGSDVRRLWRQCGFADPDPRRALSDEMEQQKPEADENRPASGRTR